MGVDWLSCEVCGETFPDCGDFDWCECGKAWCCSECSSQDGFERYDEDYEGEIPLHPKHG